MSDTNIPVSDEVWKELNSQKERGDTFDDVLRRVLGLNGDKPDVDIETRSVETTSEPQQRVKLPEDIPTTVDEAAARDAIEAAVAYLERERSATMREIVSECMREHPLGYDVPDLESGERYRGAWWRRVVRPGIELDERVAKPKPGQSEWRWQG